MIGTYFTSMSILSLPSSPAAISQETNTHFPLVHPGVTRTTCLDTKLHSLSSITHEDDLVRQAPGRRARRPDRVPIPGTASPHNHEMSGRQVVQTEARVRLGDSSAGRSVGRSSVRPARSCPPAVSYARKFSLVMHFKMKRTMATANMCSARHIFSFLSNMPILSKTTPALTQPGKRT